MMGFATRQLDEEVTHCVVVSIYAIKRATLIAVFCRYRHISSLLTLVQYVIVACQRYSFSLT